MEQRTDILRRRIELYLRYLRADISAPMAAVYQCEVDGAKRELAELENGSSNDQARNKREANRLRALASEATTPRARVLLLE